MDGLGIYEINDKYWFYYIYAESKDQAMIFFNKEKGYPSGYQLTSIKKLSDNDLDEAFTKDSMGDKISLRHWLGDEAVRPPYLIDSTLPNKKLPIAIMTYQNEGDILKNGTLKGWVRRYFKRVEFLGVKNGKPSIRIDREVWDNVRYDIPIAYPRPVRIQYKES